MSGSYSVHTAQCVGDTLGGGGGGALLDAETPPVDYAAYGSHVAAAIMVRRFRGGCPTKDAC